MSRVTLSIARFELSQTGYYADFLIVPVLALAAFCVALYGAPLPLVAVLAALGFLAWTLTEYVLHRFVFHRALKALHDRHHERPADLIGIPVYGTLGYFAVVASALILLLGMPIASAIMAGYLAGYTAYIMVHDALHHRAIGPTSGLYPLKMRHARHHSGEDAWFGIITALWDIVFRTTVPR